MQFPTKFEMAVNLKTAKALGLAVAVNLKTAKALGLAVPPSILVRADEQIE